METELVFTQILKGLCCENWDSEGIIFGNSVHLAKIVASKAKILNFIVTWEISMVESSADF